MNNRIVVLGGGSAGWLTALFVKKLLPNFSVSLIQDKDTGIIGVGEATTPHMISMLRNLEINIPELIKETKGSIKNGIHFENWNGDNNSYFHQFFEKIVSFSIPNVFGKDCENFYLKNIIKNKLDLNSYLYQPKLAYAKKIDLKNTEWALHFDATLFSNYLEKIGRERNIEVIEGHFKDAVFDQDGNISRIILEDQRQIPLDFIFDCSGFARLLIGKLFNEEWISYEEHLPMKKGMPFWLEQKKNINPYTSSIAMKYGWMWQIPLQHRIGSGYIFDSDYISEDQAVAEAEQYYQTKIKVNKIIPFKAGRFKRVWIKNCIAVGLSSSFLEPLESTSLWYTISQLELFRQFINEIYTVNENSLNLYNEIIGNNIDDGMNFIYFHYMTKRNDSKFWLEFKNKNKPPEKFQHILEILKTGNARVYDFHNLKKTASFELTSYLQVGYGLSYFDNDLNLFNYENIVPSPDEYKRMTNQMLYQAEDHNKFLKNL